jgi:putative tricarboxylic transport membrane protein
MSTRHRLPGELGFILLLIAFSAFLLWQAWRISGFESITSAGVFPMAAALVMLLSLAVVFVRSMRVPREAQAPDESRLGHFVRRLSPGVVVSFSVAIVVYMLVMEWLGFLLSSFLFLVVSMRLLGSARWILNLLLSAVMLAAIYVVFHTAFSVVLPEGTLLKKWW